MTRIPHMLDIVLIAVVGAVAMAPALPAQAGEGAERSVAEHLERATQENEPTTVSIAWDTYGLSVTAQGQASLLAVRIAGPQRAILLDQRTAGATIDWTLPDGAPDGSYRYEVFVTTTRDGLPQSSLTPGGFEVRHGQIVRP